MKIKITAKSPNGMEANPHMHDLFQHAATVRSMGSRSPLKEMREVYKYLKQASEKWCRTNNLVTSTAPLVLLYRKPECCGEEITIHQGEFNITIRHDHATEETATSNLLQAADVGSGEKRAN